MADNTGSTHTDLTPTPPDQNRRSVLGLAAGAVAGAAGLTASAQAVQAQSAANSEFAGKVMLITGATSGIGAETARRFAGYGTKVMFCGRRRALGAEVQDAIRQAGGDATYRFADVREEDSIKALVGACVKAYGRIDIAFNNAGVNGDLASGVTTDTVDTWDDVFNTNARGVWLAMKHEIPVMQAQGGGRIINTASLLGLRTIPKIAPYVASKHAVIGISQAAASQHAGDNIRINVLAPGPVDTDMLAKVHGGNPKLIEKFNQGIPTGKIATPADIAGGVEMLASKAGSYMHGAVLLMDGGKSYREYG